MEDYSDVYKFRVFAEDPVTFKFMNMEQTLKLSEYYDEKGY